MKNTNFTKKDICIDIKEKTGFSYSYSSKIINDLINILTNKITKNNLNLKNIGTFKLIKKKSRVGRNPKTKKKHIISERNSVSFTASENILKMLNQNK